MFVENRVSGRCKGVAHNSNAKGFFTSFFFVGLRNLTLISVVPHAVVKINGLPSCIKSDSRFAVFVFLLLFFLCELSEDLFSCPLLWFAKNNTRTLEK